MIAIDTNILVRIITNDGPKQAKKAVELLSKADEVFVSKTVLLETEWVLKYLYEHEHQAIIKAFCAFLGIPNVAVECPSQVARAMIWFEKGLDFADALHLAACEKADTFLSFDKKFCNKANKILSGNIRLINPDK